MTFQKFGLEIRKIGDIKSLYQEVDLVLNKNQIKTGISASIQIQTTAHALQKMLSTENHFDICLIRNLSNLCQICIPQERMLVYSSIHCMHWCEMTQDYRQLITAMILDDFRGILTTQ